MKCYRCDHEESFHNKSNGYMVSSDGCKDFSFCSHREENHPEPWCECLNFEIKISILDRIIKFITNIV